MHHNKGVKREKNKVKLRIRKTNCIITRGSRGEKNKVKLRKRSQNCIITTKKKKSKLDHNKGVKEGERKTRFRRELPPVATLVDHLLLSPFLQNMLKLDWGGGGGGLNHSEKIKKNLKIQKFSGNIDSGSQKYRERLWRDQVDRV